MSYTKEQLDYIEELAGLFFTEQDIKIIIDTPDDAEDSFELRMMRGRLKVEAEIRKSIVSHAKSGSSPAQTLADRMKRDLMIHDYLNENKR